MLKSLSISLLALFVCSVTVSAELIIEPAGGMSVTVSGQVEMADGKTVNIDETKLEFDQPKTEAKNLKAKVPNNLEGWVKGWDPWPTRDGALSLSPRRDKKSVHILGGLYHGIVNDEIVVKSADGTKEFVQGEDYLVNDSWGQIIAVDGRLGKFKEDEIIVDYKIASQRIDLVQVDGSGKVSIKKGESEIVCPMIPDADTGCKALAGIYINPGKRGGEWVVAKDDIYPINPAAPVELINPEALSGTLAKLRKGENVNIGFMGDSITLGAEACLWWQDHYTEKDLTYRGRFVYQLRKMYPKSTITPIKGYEGGKTTEYGVEIIKKSVIPNDPDLVTIAFGINDSTGPVNGKPRVAPEEFRQYITDMVKTCKAAGSEVMIITSMQPSPFLKNNHAKRYAALAQVLREVGQAENVAVADVYTEWMNMATRGIPPFTQLHNGINHPGDYGHKLYSEVLLRFFEK